MPSKSTFKLPRYLKLKKGSMFLDIDGDESSGVKLYSSNRVFVGRGKIEDKKDPPNDKFGNQNQSEYGYIEQELPWYVDTKKIPSTKLSRLIIAFNQGILEEADPASPPSEFVESKQDKDFKVDKLGDRIFVGKNKEVYVKLMNNKFEVLRHFIEQCPDNSRGRETLMDMYDYEKKGYNRVARPRLEVLDLIRNRLNKIGGAGISSIRVNED